MRSAKLGNTCKGPPTQNLRPTFLWRCVIFYYYLYTPLLTEDLFNIGYVSVFHRQTCESILTWYEYDRQFSESGSPVPNLFLDEDLSLTDGAMSSSPTPGPSLVLDSGKRALQQLISRAVPEDQLVSLIDAIFSRGNVSDIVSYLGGNGVQSFVDAMDEVCRHASHLRQIGRLTPASTSCVLIDTGEPQPHTTHPKEMSEVIIQDMCRPHHAPQITADRVMLQSSRDPPLSRWICGRLEGRIPWTGGCSQGAEDICHQ